MTLTQLGIKTVPLPCLPPTFIPSPADCLALITPKTRAILLVTPNNPTGAIYPPSLIKEFAKLARDNKVALVVDETYREFIPAEQGRPHELFGAEDEGEDWRTYLIQLFSFSKCVMAPSPSAPPFASDASLTLCLRFAHAGPMRSLDIVSARSSLRSPSNARSTRRWTVSRSVPLVPHKSPSPGRWKEHGNGARASRANSSTARRSSSTASLGSRGGRSRPLEVTSPMYASFLSISLDLDG